VLRWPGGNFVSGYHWTDGLEVRPTSRHSARVAVGRTSSPTVAQDRGRPDVRGDELFGHGPGPT
jgi:hypothetical protein